MKLDIMGLQVDNVTMDEASARAEQILAGKKTCYAVTPNAEIAYEALYDETLRALINGADLVLPGGLGGVHSILASETAMNFIRLAYEKNCLIAAICAAPTILASLHITDGRRATCYPGLDDQRDAAQMIPCGAVQDGNVITGRAAGSADEFGLACLRALKGEDTARQVASDIVYRV